MDKNEQRIAIAEACEWHEEPEPVGSANATAWWHNGDRYPSYLMPVPDYLEDLNEIHKAFASQPHLTQLEVIYRLVANKPAASPIEAVAYSTAEDWAKALLQALSLWVDSPD